MNALIGESKIYSARGNFSLAALDSTITKYKAFLGEENDDVLENLEKLKKKLNEVLRCAGTNQQNLSGEAGRGQTSIDIYPEGWDKLFSLKHFDPVKCRFIGDSCYGDGNDQPLFSYFLEKGSAWCVSSPVQTEEIIRDLILTESKFNKSS